MKFDSLVVICEGCGSREVIQRSASKRAFMLKLNRFIRQHRMHEFKAKVGEWKLPKISKNEKQKRELRRMPTYGVTKQ